ncbi:unnamed protein product [Caenorhabditis angaria]|uniref:Uncharacterized protein n=1 Tax=Caenorhabditis angaria TaxID=860376 RepID=A0A9P1IAD4_9PELO|nr:unnamed protein product [Caenorhabditis angaria]
MCNKVDNSVQIFGCIKAVKALIAIAIAWAILGIIIVVVCILAANKASDEFLAEAEKAKDPKEKKRLEAAAEIAKKLGISLGSTIASIPFSNAICLGILICAECAFLYIIVGLIGCLSLMGNIGYLVHVCLKAGEKGKPAGEAILDNLGLLIGAVLGVFLTFTTVYAMFALACCGDQRQAGSGETSEDEYEIEEDGTTTTTGTTITLME